MTIHPERIVPAETPAGPLAAHLVRYEFALSYCSGRVVLDAACGVAYGANRLAATAARVVGVDIDEGALQYGRRVYPAANLVLGRADVLNMPISNASVDVVCSFETIEHVHDPAQLVAELRRVLRRGGVALVSTPHVRRTNRRPANPFHRVEYSRRDFEALLREQFRAVRILGQRRRQTRLHAAMQGLDVLGLRRLLPGRIVRAAALSAGTTPWADAGLADFEITNDLRGATELLAICTNE